MQAGAGGTALATAIYLREMMKTDGYRAAFMRGGSTKYLVEMLEEIRTAGIAITVAGIPEHARRVFHAVGEERWRGSPVEPIKKEPIR